MENTSKMIDLLKSGTLLSIQFLVMTKGANMQSDSEFELEFPMERYDELREELELKRCVELYNLPTKNGKDIILQNFNCVEIHKSKQELITENATKFKADFLGVVMNRKEFKNINSNTMNDITATTYEI